MELAQLKEGLYPAAFVKVIANSGISTLGPTLVVVLGATRPAGTDSSQPRAIASGPCRSLFNGFLPGPKLATGFAA